MSSNIYLKFLNSQDGKEYMKYMKKETDNINNQIIDYFINLRKSNLITFGCASIIDSMNFGYSGNFWISAYNYPREGDPIYKNQKKIGTAKNVGLLTFSIEE